MKRLFIFALSALLFAVTGYACAQVTYDNPCGVAIPPGERKPYNDFASGTMAYQCAPVQSAKSTWPTVRYSAAGAVGWWYCKVGPRWYANWVAGTTAFFFTNNVAGEALAAAAGADPVAALNAVAKKYTSLPLNDPSLTPVWCPVQAEMYAGMPAADAPPPPAPKFVVAPAGTNLTRPAFAFSAGKRSYSSTSQVAVGAACDCSVQIVEGRLTFCSIAPALVAVCVPAAP